MTDEELQRASKQVLGLMFEKCEEMQVKFNLGRTDAMLSVLADQMSMLMVKKAPESLPIRVERVVAVALQYDALVFSLAPPARHCHVLNAMHNLGLLEGVDKTREQGFVTSLGRYVSREEACQIARACGQLEGRVKTGGENTLYSEDLW